MATPIKSSDLVLTGGKPVVIFRHHPGTFLESGYLWLDQAKTLEVPGAPGRYIYTGEDTRSSNCPFVLETVTGDIVVALARNCKGIQYYYGASAETVLAFKPLKDDKMLDDNETFMTKRFNKPDIKGMRELTDGPTAKLKTNFYKMLHYSRMFKRLKLTDEKAFDDLSMRSFADTFERALEYAEVDGRRTVADESNADAEESARAGAAEKEHWLGVKARGEVLEKEHVDLANRVIFLRGKDEESIAAAKKIAEGEAYAGLTDKLHAAIDVCVRDFDDMDGSDEAQPPRVLLLPEKPIAQEKPTEAAKDRAEAAKDGVESDRESEGPLEGSPRRSSRKRVAVALLEPDVSSNRAGAGRGRGARGRGRPPKVAKVPEKKPR